MGCKHTETNSRIDSLREALHQARIAGTVQVRELEAKIEELDSRLTRAEHENEKLLQSLVILYAISKKYEFVTDYDFYPENGAASDYKKRSEGMTLSAVTKSGKKVWINPLS